MTGGGTKKIRRSGYFGKVPSSAIYDQRLGAAGLRVLAALATYADATDRCFPAQTTIAADLGVSRQAVSKQIDQLITLGHLKIESRYRPNGSQSANEYQIIHHDRNSGPKSGGYPSKEGQREVDINVNSTLRGGATSEVAGGATSEVAPRTDHMNRPDRTAVTSTSSRSTSSPRARTASTSAADAGADHRDEDVVDQIMGEVREISGIRRPIKRKIVEGWWALGLSQTEIVDIISYVMERERAKHGDAWTPNSPQYFDRPLRAFAEDRCRRPRRVDSSGNVIPADRERGIYEDLSKVDPFPPSRPLTPSDDR